MARQDEAEDPCVEARMDWDRLGSSPSFAVLEAFISIHADCPLYRVHAEELQRSLGQEQESLASLEAALAEAYRDLEAAEAASAESLRQVTILSDQVEALRRQLGSLQFLLDDAAEREDVLQAQISTLGNRLNTALAQLATEQRD